MQLKDPKEPYLPGHKNLDDSVLLEPPERRFTPLKLFVCTYVAKLDNLHMDFVKLSERFCEDPHGALLATNSNYGHACQPGYEHLLKLPKEQVDKYTPSRSRPRKVQGDGTCFNSAVEPVVGITHPGIKNGKVYKIKCFPSTGETQVPGVVCPDLSDGGAVLRAFVGYLNELGVGDRAGPELPPTPIGIVHEGPNMLNYKWRLVRNSPRILIDTCALADYFTLLEMGRLVAGMVPTSAHLARFAEWPAVLLPPYPIRETKPPTDDVKVSFRFKTGSRSPRVNVFQEGKMNVLGAQTEESVHSIYAFFEQLFEANWYRLVCLQPRHDKELKQRSQAMAAPLRAPRKPAPDPIPSIPDVDIARLIKYGFLPDTASMSAEDVPAPTMPDAKQHELLREVETLLDDYLDEDVSEKDASSGEFSGEF